MPECEGFAKSAPRLGADFASAGELIPPRVTAVECRRPASGETFQVRQGTSALVNCGEYRGQVTLLPGRPSYDTRANPKRRLLRVAVNSLGNVFLWPVPCDRTSGGRMQELLRDAESGWVVVHWDRSTARYEHRTVQLNHQPRWPQESLKNLIVLAFPQLYQTFLREAPGNA